MRDYRRILFLLFVAVAVGAASAMATLLGQGQSKEQNQNRCAKSEHPKEIDKSHWPIADASDFQSCQYPKVMPL